MGVFDSVSDYPIGFGIGDGPFGYGKGRAQNARLISLPQIG
uniref:Uncharacterized protein n=1 Tax=Candidatus Kentrum eta TaxID=2126337 RepID=A0A450VPR5_9GAMM|nr:MAG: hypothetical protein BECKH772C_GA0070978_103734 [Candidatus Kentron sp. H]